MYSKELELALEAMRKITDTADMHVLASEYNRHITFLGKMKAKKFSVVIGDTVVLRSLVKFTKSIQELFMCIRTLVLQLVRHRLS